MNVYVVVYGSAYGKVIDKIFITESKANAYCAEQNKNHPTFYHKVERYWAI